MRTSLWRERAPVAWVLVLARFHWMSGTSVEAERPVSAPPVREKRADEPEARGAELKATVPVAVIVPTVSPPIEEVAVTNPPSSKSKVEVELAKLPPQVVAVNGKAPPPPVASEPQTRNPFSSVLMVSQERRSSNLMPL